MNTAATLITVLRHGELEGPANVLRGSSDTPLSGTGWQQMRAACAALDPPVTAIATSPLIRCRTFAQAFAAQQALPITVHDDLREIDFGAWENLLPDEARTSTPELFAQFQTSPEGTSPPDGEPFDAFKLRVLTAFDTCLTQTRGGHLLMVTHAGVMRVLLADKMNLPWATTYHIAIPPAGGFRLSCLAGHEPYLLSLNSICVA